MLIIGTDTDPLTLQLVAALCGKDLSRRVWLNKPMGGVRSASNVGSVAPCDLGIEIGPQPHGLCRADVYRKAVELVNEALTFAENALGGGGGEWCKEGEVVVYRWTGEVVPFPLDAHGEVHIGYSISLNPNPNPNPNPNWIFSLSLSLSY